MTFQKPKGTNDFYPDDFAVRERIFNILKAVAQRYNFRQIESPAFESLDLLTRKEGEEIKQQIFTLDKRGDEQFGLRFDLTIPAARMFISIQKSAPKPVKWFFLSRMWRYEQPQQGRLREFYQFSCECFGSSKQEADAEILSLAIDSLLAIGLKKGDFVVRLNSRKLLEGILSGLVEKRDLPDVIKVIDRKAKISVNEFNSELKKAGLDSKSVEKLSRILSINDIQEIELENDKIREAVSEINSILNLLGDKKEFVRLDLSTARGLAYYTGTVFEIFDSNGKYRSIAGGGRYDNLVELLGGQPAPATGFAIGYATLQLILKDKGLIPENDLAPDYFIAVVGDDVKEKALEIASKLRKKYSVEIDICSRNLGSQMQFANTIKAKKVIIVGKRELAEGKVTVKDMVSGEEKRVSVDRINSLPQP